MEWRKIEGYTRYSVSDAGFVRNDKTGRILKPGVGRYCSVVLCENNTPRTAQVHRLVALAFIPNPLNKPEVNHKDGNTGNNHVSNLEWATHAENQRHKCYVLGRERQMKPVVCEDTGEFFPSIKYAARVLGGNAKGLKLCLRGKQNTWNGLHWKFAP